MPQLVAYLEQKVLRVVRQIQITDKQGLTIIRQLVGLIDKKSHNL